MSKIIDSAKSHHIDGTKYADVIYGMGGNDTIAGHKGNDKLYGGDGNDKIGGGEGHDILSGGAGIDTFIFRSFNAADSDTVVDFKHGTDLLEFDRTVFTTVPKGIVAASEFVLGTAAHDKNDHFIYDHTTGNLWYDDDGNGAHLKHLVATLSNHTTLAHDDLIII